MFLKNFRFNENVIRTLLDQKIIFCREANFEKKTNFLPFRQAIPGLIFFNVKFTHRVALHFFISFFAFSRKPKALSLFKKLNSTLFTWYLKLTKAGSKFSSCTVFWILFYSWQLRKSIQNTVQLEIFLARLIL